MNVVNLVILLENVACGLAHEAWEVDGVEALALVLVGVQVMGAGAIARMQENLHDVEAYRLVEVAATAGHLHIAVLAMIHLLLMETDVGVAESNAGWH